MALAITLAVALPLALAMAIALAIPMPPIGQLEIMLNSYKSGTNEIHTLPGGLFIVVRLFDKLQDTDWVPVRLEDDPLVFVVT